MVYNKDSHLICEAKLATVNKDTCYAAAVAAVYIIISTCVTHQTESSCLLIYLSLIINIVNKQ